MCSGGVPTVRCGRRSATPAARSAAPTDWAWDHLGRRRRRRSMLAVPRTFLEGRRRKSLGGLLERRPMGRPIQPRHGSARLRTVSCHDPRGHGLRVLAWHRRRSLASDRRRPRAPQRPLSTGHGTARLSASRRDRPDRATYVFWMGTNAELWEGYWNGAQWVGPFNRGMGPAGSEPSVAMTPVGMASVFWRGTDGALWQAIGDARGPLEWTAPNRHGASWLSPGGRDRPNRCDLRVLARPGRQSLAGALELGRQQVGRACSRPA